MRHPSRALVLALTAAITLTAGRAAWAQGESTSIDVNTYWPAPGPGSYFGVRGSEIAPHLGVGFTLDANYQHRPLVLEDVESGDQVDAVDYQVTADFLWSFGLFNWVQIGLGLPTVLAMDGAGASPITGGARLSTTAIRDLRLEVKGRFLGAGPNGTVGSGFGLAFAAALTVPTGDRDNFAGDRNVVGEPVLIADYRHRYFSVAANLGARLREASRIADVEVGHQLTFGLGVAGYLVDQRLQILGEVTGLVGLTGVDSIEYRGDQVDIHGDQLVMEGRLGLGYVPDANRDITIRLAGAAGFTDAVGTPQFRVLASLQYQPMNRDADGDGVFDRDDECDDGREDMDEFDDEDGCPDPDNDEDGVLDEADECPDEPEDVDEVDDEDGCPDGDNDGDGVYDDDDSCPTEAEDMDEFEDEDGCPDPDNDDDGVLDANDRCSTEAEDRDEFEDDDGCPDLDNDGDEIPDADDQCPTAAEDRDDYEDEDGCPDPDNDGDGVLDADDRCPDQAETVNGVEDGDGCADRGAGVAVRDGAFVLTGRIVFPRGSSTVPPALLVQLDQVALHLRTAALAGQTVVVNGYGDAADDSEATRTLATARADAVRAALIERGLPEARVEAVAGNPGARPRGLQVELRLRSPE